MYIRLLRHRKQISQEQLAELCGVSLRTIQRVETGHRVGYATMRALAKAFEIDVDELERELYAMKTTMTEYREIPLWVRIILGRGLFFGSRSHLYKVEILCICIGAGSLVFWVASLILPYVQDPLNGSLYFGLFLFFCAYWATVCIRVGERYRAWSQETEKYNEAPRDANAGT